MEAIKTKYDRLLLGLCALAAIIIGALLIMKIIGFGSQFTVPPKANNQQANLGEDKSADIDKAVAALGTISKRIPLSLPGGRVADLFVSTPVLKTADGQVLQVLDEATAPIRPPIANRWLYQYDLDITREDIAQVDSDGDGYTNSEEFEGDSDPKNRADVPPFYSKLRYKECVKEPLSLRFAIYNENNGEIQLSRTEPKPTRNAFMRVGEVFPHDSRFKVIKVEMREIKSGGVTEQKPVLILEDSLAKIAQPLEIPLGATVERPGLSAKLFDELSSKEFILKEGADFQLPKLPGTKILIVKVTEESVTISFILPGKTERQEHEIKLK